MRRWATVKLPNAFWLTGFTYPTGFLTALLQTTARKKNGVSIDSIAFEFPIINQDPLKITQPPKRWRIYIWPIY